MPYSVSASDIKEYTIYSDELEFIRIDIESNFFLFSKIIDKIYSELKEDYFKIKEEFEADLKGTDEKYKISIYQMYSEELHEREKLIPHFMFKSLFLSIYNYYESILFIDFIEKVLKFQKSKAHAFKWNDFISVLKNKKIEPGITDAFDFYRQLRNSFVHRNGYITSSELKKKVEGNANLMLKEKYCSIKKAQFIKDVLSFMNRFTEALLLETERKVFGKKD